MPKATSRYSNSVAVKRKKKIHFKENRYGFEYGSAEVTRLFSDTEKGWITLGLETPKHKGNRGIQIYVTKTGKVRVFSTKGEWFVKEKE